MFTVYATEQWQAELLLSVAYTVYDVKQDPNGTIRFLIYNHQWIYEPAVKFKPYSALIK